MTLENPGARKNEKVAQKPARYSILTNRTESQETQKALVDKGLERLGKNRRNPVRLYKHPLGESNPRSRTENPMS